MINAQITEQQLAFLRALWARGEASVGEVQAALAEAGTNLAPTTVSTVLSRLEKKGLVEHRPEGRAYVYRATISEDAVQTSVLGRVRDRLFGGDVTALVGQLLDTSSVSTEELAQVRRLLDAKQEENGR